MSYWDVPQGRALLRVSAGRPMDGCKVPFSQMCRCPFKFRERQTQLKCSVA